jgi:hypothetical protein
MPTLSPKNSSSTSYGLLLFFSFSECAIHLAEPFGPRVTAVMFVVVLSRPVLPYTLSSCRQEGKTLENYMLSWERLFTSAHPLGNHLLPKHLPKGLTLLQYLHPSRS